MRGFRVGKVSRLAITLAICSANSTMASSTGIRLGCHLFGGILMSRTNTALIPTGVVEAIREQKPVKQNRRQPTENN